MNTRFFLTALFTAAISLPALALDQKPYDAKEFAAAQAAGKSVVAFVSAPWCNACKKQHQVLDKVASDPALADITVYSIDFDTQQAIWRDFKVPAQSSMVAFQGTKETGRLVGDTSEAGVVALLKSSTGK